jgi:GTP pyrophosphokinase
MPQLIEKKSTVQRQELLRQLEGVGDPDPALAAALDLAVSVSEDDRPRPKSIAVVRTLQRLGVDRTTLIATLLSDPRLRDSLSEAEIRTTFGNDIADLVSSVHWLNTFKECEHEMAQAPQQAERLRRMLLAMIKDIRAMVIKLGYRLERLRILPRQGYETRRCIARETLDIYAPLANRLGIAQLKWELEDLSLRYLEPQAYKQIASGLEEKRTARETYIATFVNTLREALAKENIDGEINGRPKHIYSIWRKMHQKARSLQELYDLRAVRVIVERISDCYAALGVVHSLWQHIPKEFDDYIANPKGNGYRSLHTAIMGPEGRVVEVQIRTREMHEFAERGVAAHWLYKEGGEHHKVMQRSINALRRVLEADDGDSVVIENFKNELFQDRVFVVTPTGEILELPRGATPLDFAYSIHTEVGHRCRGAKVNGRIVPLTYNLNSGEKVEILTAKQGHPSRDWLNPHLGYLHTTRARSKVRYWFKQQDRERNIQEGRTIVDRELQRLGVKGTKLEDIVARFNLHSLDELLAEVGRGEISITQIVSVLQVPEISPPRLPVGDARQSTTKQQDAGSVMIRGVGNLLTQIARCCKPMPGDSIVGFITRGKGVTIHRNDCTNIVNLKDERRTRLVEVDWGPTGDVYAVSIRIEAYDRQGLLRDIATVLSNEAINLIRANTLTNQEDQTVAMDLTVEVTNTGQLSRLLDKILQVPNVIEASRHSDLI